MRAGSSTIVVADLGGHDRSRVVADRLIGLIPGRSFAATAHDAARVLARGEVDLVVVVDLGPDRAAAPRFCAAVQAWPPVGTVVCSGTVNDARRAELLDAGADDVVSVVDSDEIIAARLNVVLRRVRRHGSPQIADDAVSVGPLTVDRAAHLVAIAGDPIRFTHREYLFLLELVGRTEQIVPTDELAALGATDGRPLNDRGVRTSIGVIRRELAARTGALVVDAVRPVGYRLRRRDPRERTGGRRVAR